MIWSPLRRTLAIVVVFASAVILPASAAAVLSGRDGRIVFVSGREGADGDDSQAKLYFWRSPPDAFSPAVGPALDTAAGQHRHPTWSPDRTKIAYARGTADSNPATQNFDIYIKDLVTGAVQPLTNTTDSLSADRPAWSPDGTRIAFEHQPTDASADRIIRIENVGGGGIDLTPAGAPLETKPAWTPDSQTLYYATGDVNVAPNGNNNDVKIVREPADNTGSPTAADPYQRRPCVPAVDLARRNQDLLHARPDGGTEHHRGHLRRRYQQPGRGEPARVERQRRLQLHVVAERPQDRLRHGRLHRAARSWRRTPTSATSFRRRSLTTRATSTATRTGRRTPLPPARTARRPRS